MDPSIFLVRPGSPGTNAGKEGFICRPNHFYDKLMEMKTRMTTDERPARYICLECAYIYDPARGDRTQNIPPGTPFERLPRTWKCPECRISILKRGVFKKLEE